MTLRIPRPPLAIMTSLKEEFAAVTEAFPEAQQLGINIVRCGLGWESAVKATEQIMNVPNPPMVICATGICGALKPGIDVGDLVIADTLVGPTSQDFPYKIQPDWLTLQNKALTNAKLKFHTGLMLTSKEAVTKPPIKRALGESRNALAVDMESYAILTTIDPRLTRVFALRAVSDSVDDELPDEVGEFLNQQGEPRIGRITQFALRKPKNPLVLIELRKRSRIAAANLTAAWKSLWPLIKEKISTSPG